MYLELLLCCTSLIAQADPQQAVTEPRPVSAEKSAVPRPGAPNLGAILGPEDTLIITAFNAEEISKTWRISPNGELVLPMLGKIKAAGMTVQAFQNELTERLKRFVYDPQVSVYIAETRSRPVTVTGAVEHPGIMQLDGDQTLLDVLVRAGVREAGPKVTVTRPRATGPLPVPQAQITPDGLFFMAEFDLQEILNARSPLSATVMRPNDVVNVAPRQPRLVHIIGEVVRPGSVELVTQESIPLSRLVATAGGFTRGASAKKAIIRRGGKPGDVATQTVDLKKLLAGRTEDLELSSGDIVIVPSSRMMTYLQAMSSSAVTAGIFATFQILARY